MMFKLGRRGSRHAERALRRWYSSEPKAAAAAAKGATNPTAGESSGGAGKVLLLAAVVAPPAYVAYMTKYDASFRETFRERFPSLFDSVSSLVGPTSVQVDGLDVSALKKELADLEKRWNASGSHTEKFSKAEVDAMQATLSKVQQSSSTPQSPASPVPSQEATPEKQEESTPSGPEEEKVGEEGGKEEEALVPPAREKLDALRAKARQVKAKADRETEKKIRDIEKELRADLEIVLAHDLKDLDEEGLRQRLVQLVLELKDRNRWEALRMHELTKKHTEDLVEKYDRLLREQQDRYEELIRYETALAASKASEHVQQQAEDHFNRVLSNKELQWQRHTQESLDRQRSELGREMEQRFQQAKASIETKAAEDLKTRLATLTQLKDKVQQLQQALSSRSENDKSSKRLHDMSIAMVDLQDALYKNPSTLGQRIAQLEKVAAGDNVVQSALKSLSSRVRSGTVPTEMELVQRFGSVYDNCYRVALVPEDGGVLEHAVAHVVAGLTIRGGSNNDGDTNSQQAALSRARYMLLEKKDLDASVKELQGLKGAVRDTASDWMTDAQDRLAVEQAISLIKTHIVSLSSNLNK